MSRHCTHRPPGGHSCLTAGARGSGSVTYQPVKDSRTSWVTVPHTRRAWTPAAVRPSAPGVRVEADFLGPARGRPGPREDMPASVLPAGVTAARTRGVCSPQCKLLSRHCFMSPLSLSIILLGAVPGSFAFCPFFPVSLLSVREVTVDTSSSSKILPTAPCRPPGRPRVPRPFPSLSQSSVPRCPASIGPVRLPPFLLKPSHTSESPSLPAVSDSCSAV